MPRFREWFVALSARERWLILLMIAIALPLLTWLLVIRPLDRAYDRALERHVESVARNGRIKLLAEAPGQTRAPSATAGTELGLVVAEAATQAGLTLESNSASGANSVTVVIAQAQPGGVLPWLHGLELRGIRIEDLRMAPAGEATISTTARLVRHSG